MAGSVTDDAPKVIDVLLDGKVVGQVFGVGRRFYFILTDERDDKPRGWYRNADVAVEAAWHQAKVLEQAEFWEMMLDT
jgi:hypothetical protein